MQNKKNDAVIMAVVGYIVKMLYQSTLDVILHIYIYCNLILHIYIVIPVTQTQSCLHKVTQEFYKVYTAVYSKLTDYYFLC